jgi:Tfp pilus assembly protein PilF
MRKRLVPILCLVLTLGACSTQQKRKAEIKKQKKIQLQAMKHYRLGIDDYVNTKYAQAITEWKQTLVLDPENPNAKEYIERAEKAQKAISSIKAPPQ